MKVYLLYWYQEYGPEDLVATTDKSKVQQLFDKFAEPFKSEKVAEYREKLMAALEADEVGQAPLGRGWGGPVLEIVELA